MTPPSGLIAATTAGQRIRFRPTSELDERVLVDLSDVVAVHRDGAHLVVTGTANLLFSVVSAPARDVVPADFRMEQPSLEDAFVALTGRTFELETV